MNLSIHNAEQLAAIEPIVIGAAMRILQVGGLALPEQKQRSVSGLSKWHWATHGTAVLALLCSICEEKA